MPMIPCFAPLFSSVQRLAADHMLICLGPRGTFIEFDDRGAEVWKYISPVHENGSILNQGDDIGDVLASNNSVFHITHYPIDFVGFSEKDMSPGLPIEGPRIISAVNDYLSPTLKVYPNPAVDFIVIEGHLSEVDHIEIYSQSGNLIKTVSQQNQVDISDLAAGLYFVRADNLHPSKLIICR